VIPNTEVKAHRAATLNRLLGRKYLPWRLNTVNDESAVRSGMDEANHAAAAGGLSQVILELGAKK